MQNNNQYSEIEIPNRKFLINGREIEMPPFDCYAWKFMELPDVIIVLFWGTKTFTNSNVYGYDKTGRLLWKSKPVSEDSDSMLPNSYCYIIWSPSHQKVFLVSSLENNVWLDEKTGETTPIPTSV